MFVLGILLGVALILAVLLDTFEVMLLPRRVTHGYRFARFYYRSMWAVWRRLARLFSNPRRRNFFLGCFGPLSLFGLMAAWALGLILGFALIFWSAPRGVKLPAEFDGSFGNFVYFSGTNFFTLGYGDFLPAAPWSRLLGVGEAGMGLGFFAMVISYLPVLYQAFSRREITISLLDARAGSPPTSGELLRRLAAAGSLNRLHHILGEWERWSAELLESHLSFPLLSFYRSQHDNQSWLATLTVILDTSSLVIAGLTGEEAHQARLTFAMARHAAVDLCLVFAIVPDRVDEARVTAEELKELHASLGPAAAQDYGEGDLVAAVDKLRALYEPFLVALSAQFQMAIPSLTPRKPVVDNWQTTPWKNRSPAIADLPTATNEAEHFG